MFKKILVAVDGYNASLEAAKKAVDMAAQYGSQVIALQVVEEMPLLKIEEEMEKAALKGEDQKPLTEKPLDLVATYGHQQGVAVETHLEQGGITACILKASEEKGVDLIIIGDSGRRGVQKFYFGSVAQAVSENAKCPVLIMKKGAVDISDMLELVPAIEESVKLKKEVKVKPVFKPEAFKRSFNFSFTLFFVFAVIYFGAVLLASKPMKDTAAMMIIGMPLAVWAGLITIISGVIITRIYLAKKD